MHFHKYDPKDFKQSTSTTRIKTLFDNHGNSTDTPFKCALIEILPSQESKPHKHDDIEIFTIIKGEGIADFNNEQKHVQAGDVIYFPPFVRHSIRNLSAESTLLYQAVWWKPIELSAPFNQPAQKQSFIIFSTAPTPNGDLHLGHLAGPYLAADILFRSNFIHTKKNRHYFGFDSNQSYVFYKANNLKLSVTEILDRYQTSILKTLTMAQINIEPDSLLSSSSFFTQSFISSLSSGGYIYKKTARQAYCKKCEIYLHEAYLSGICDHCGNNISGSICEACYKYTCESIQTDPTCNICHSYAELHLNPQWFLRLSSFKEDLDIHHKKSNLPEVARSFVTSCLNELDDIPISHWGDWGCHSTIDDEQVNFFSFIELASTYAKHMQNSTQDNSSQVVQCLGVDNMFYRLILIPALLMGYNQQIKLPSSYIVNFFYSLEGMKFSTSRQHVIPLETLANQFSIDGIRYYLCLTRPATKSTNFDLQLLSGFLEKHLNSPWESFLEKLSSVPNFTDCVSPGLWTERQISFFDFLQNCVWDAKKYYDPKTFNPQNACLLFNTLINQSLDFIEAQLPIFENVLLITETKTSIVLLKAALKVISFTTSPIMPSFSEKVSSALMLKTDAFDDNNLLDDCEQEINLELLRYRF